MKVLIKQDRTMSIYKISVEGIKNILLIIITIITELNFCHKILLIRMEFFLGEEKILIRIRSEFIHYRRNLVSPPAKLPLLL